MEVKKICVIGGGTMGNGIAQVSAMGGFDVALRDVEDAFLQRAMSTIQNSLGRLVKSGKMTQDQAEAALSRVQPTTDLAAAVRDADVVVEAVPEILDLKKRVFKDLDDLCAPGTILSTNTSQLSITAIASATKRPDKVIGMHWFMPPVLMRLIEIVRGLDTSDETVATIQELSEKLGKETVVCRDSQGFITTRALQALVNECMRMLEEGVASAADIDKALKLGLNHPMGPFELLDYSGSDIAFHANEGLEEVYGERFRNPQILRLHQAAGHLGRKTGKGFYDYTSR